MGIKEEFQEKFDRIINAIDKCVELNKTDYLVEMSKEQLNSMYDFFEEGLIDYNLVLQKYPDELIWSLKVEDKKIEKMLEGKLLEIACKSLKIDSSQEIFNKYLDSLWIKKLKEKRHYNEICIFAGIPENLREKLYGNYLCSC
jgi:hypothetical protein